MSEQSLSSQIFTRKMLICVFTGFSSGLPLFVLLQMLPVWLTDKGLSVELIGALTGVMVPYGLKFLWAPLLDRYFPHFLGRRRRALSSLALLARRLLSRKNPCTFAPKFDVRPLGSCLLECRSRRSFSLFFVFACRARARLRRR